jgi:hypothetical protein
MKFEFSYGQEATGIEGCEVESKATPVLIRTYDGIAFETVQRARATWNQAVFFHPSSPITSSVCTCFTLASRALYSDELSALAKKLSHYTSEIAWPDLGTIDRHYFVQVLSGVIHCALPEVDGLVLVNRDDYYSGREYPIFEVSVRRLSMDMCGRNRSFLRPLVGS